MMETLPGSILHSIRILAWIEMNHLSILLDHPKAQRNKYLSSLQASYLLLYMCLQYSFATWLVFRLKVEYEGRGRMPEVHCAINLFPSVKSEWLLITLMRQSLLTGMHLDSLQRLH